MEVYSQFQSPAALLPRKEAPVPIGWRLCGPNNREENGLSPKTIGCPAYSLITVSTELSRLLKVELSPLNEYLAMKTY
jgi:hypothetical protein